MPGRDEQAEETRRREIVTTRVLDAPRELVFAAFARPDAISRWWGPSGFTTTTHSFAFRVGGAWHHTMHGPDGADYPNRLVYDEIVRPARIVYSREGDGKDGVAVLFQNTVTFETEGERTLLTLRQVFPTAEARDAAVEKYKADVGSRQMLERLSAQVAVSGPELGKPTLVMVRTFDAPRSLVFEAWTKAEHVRQWFTPRPLTSSACQVDFRPGGTFSVTMRFPEGSEHAFVGKFGEIDPPGMLSFSGTMPDGNEVLTRVTFDARGEQTTVTVVQSYAFESNATRGAPMGWTASLDQLGEVVATLRRH